MSEPIKPSMRDFLIEHINGPVALIRRPVNVPGMPGQARTMIRYVAMNHGWIRQSTDGRFTELTRLGRETLAKALGDWADAIWRWSGDERPRLPPFQSTFLKSNT